MRQRRFIPDAWDGKILNHQLALFAQLVAKVDFITSLNTARAMLRGLEAAARRLVFVLALTAPGLKPYAPKAMSQADAQRLDAYGPRAPSRRFRLIEPMPMTGALKRLNPPDKRPQVTRIPLASLGLAQHFDAAAAKPAPSLPAFDDITPWDHVMARVDALKDVAARPDHHARRLNRWMARQAGRREAGRFARTSPLLAGRPQALKLGDYLDPIRHPRDPIQMLLFDSHQLCARAASP